jgi:hypothetical protein
MNLRDEPVLVDRLLALSFRHLGPHLYIPFPILAQ